jgi:cytoskeletal protein RodZ
VTKINPTYLAFLEEGRFAELPARVYVRGFVAAYASSIGLDPNRVAGSYMKGYEAARPEHRRIRFSKAR